MNMTIRSHRLVALLTTTSVACALAGIAPTPAWAVVCANTNFGQNSGNDGGVASNMACGFNATAAGNGSANTATGNVANASGTSAFNTAIGTSANASSG